MKKYIFLLSLFLLPFTTYSMDKEILHNSGQGYSDSDGDVFYSCEEAESGSESDLESDDEQPLIDKLLSNSIKTKVINVHLEPINVSNQKS